MKYYVGIDLGGTNIVAGVVDEQYNILAKASTKTNCPRPDREIARDMAKMAIQAVENAKLTMDQIEWIGIGTPGIANSRDGIIEYSNNLGFVNTPMVKYIQEDIDKPVFVENDANAAAYGEFVAGAAKGANNAVCITLGTGVGGGNPDSSMHKLVAERSGKVSARIAFDAMRMGDAAAKAVVDDYIKYLAAGITNTINTFQPDILCIGGGVCNEGDALLLPVKELVAKEVYTRNSKQNAQIVIAKLGNDAGIIGAAFLGNAQ